MLDPIRTVFLAYPMRAFFTVLMMVTIGIVSLYYFKKMSEKKVITKEQGIIIWILLNYVVLILFFTVFGRRSLDYYRYILVPGSSYRNFLETGSVDILIEVCMNVVVFIPVGILLSLLIKKKWFVSSILVGFILSLTIELLQLILRTGYFEVDDLIHNTLGSIVGNVIVILIYLRKEQG